MKKNRIVKNVIENGRIVSGPDYRDMGAVLLFVFLLPYIISFFFGNAGSGYEEEENISAVMGTKIFEEDYKKADFIVRNKTAAGTESMPLETYLTCRLPATISMDYEPEALKAQAVILRTELMRSYYDSMDGGNGKAGKDNVTYNKDGKHYIYVESGLAMTDGSVYEKCKAAVSETKGMYMTYNGYPIMAPYFAVSAGATRNGNEVFKCEDYPYLKSVMCERDFTALEYAQTVRMNKKTFLLRLKEAYPELVPEEGVIDSISIESVSIDSMLKIERDRAGYVTEVSAGGAVISGEAFRAAFSLASSCFTVEEEGKTILSDNIIIKSKGIGHGLGFGQYGANEAAKKGSDFIDILNYFFSDIVIEKTE